MPKRGSKLLGKQKEEEQVQEVQVKAANNEQQQQQQNTHTHWESFCGGPRCVCAIFWHSFLTEFK